MNQRKRVPPRICTGLACVGSGPVLTVSARHTYRQRGAMERLRDLGTGPTLIFRPSG
jgi:hypothetical protein